MYYLITIRKSRVKEYVSKQQLDVILDHLATFPFGTLIVDKGYHIHGVYRQLHLHAIIRIRSRSITWVNGFRIYYSEIDPSKRSIPNIERYIHSDDWDNLDQLKEILCINYYNNHYGFIGD